MANETPSTPPDVINVNRAYQNAWIVYINGLEVPVASVTVSYGVWKIPQAEIVMLPDPILQRIGAEDRVTVQVFYCDQWINARKPEFRLLFDGEIIGWNYVNVDKSRTISFSCVDYIQIFTQLFFFFMSGIDDIAVGAGAEMIGVNAAGVNIAGLGCLFPYSMFAEGLISRQVEGADTATALITRPIDYVYNVVRGFTDTNVPLRSIPACNFFSPWCMRTKFNRRFLALPILEQDPEQKGASALFPILRSVQADYAVAALYKATANIGSAGSIWEVFENILSTVMMELAMLPTPIAVRSSLDLHIHGPVNSDKNGNLISHTGKSPIHLGNYFVKPQLLFGLPPTCNVFFPSQITSIAYQENYATQPTRMYFSSESFLTHLNQSTSSAGQASIVRNALSVAHPEEVNLVMQDALANPGENGKNTLVYPEEFFRGPVIDRRAMPRWFTFLADSANDGINSSPATTPEDASKLAQDVPPGDSTRNLFRKYAGYEFAKEKYARRNGGLHMPFNPYPVPGFPCAVFDQRHTQLDLFGYVMSVTHSLSSRSMTTDIGFSYGRTIKEAFELLRKQVALENAVISRERADVYAKLKDKTNDITGEVNRTLLPNRMERVGAIAIAPAEPIREIRDVTQSFVRAESFYRSLFHGFKDPAALDVAPKEEQKEVNREVPTANDQNASNSSVFVDDANVDPSTQSIPETLMSESGVTSTTVPVSTGPTQSTTIAGDPTTTSLPPEVQYDPVNYTAATYTEPSLITEVDEKKPAWTNVAGMKKTAVFHYDQVVQFRTSKGIDTRINMTGMDGTTRRELIGYIDKMRTNSATPDQVDQVTKAVNAINSVVNIDFSNLTQKELNEQLSYCEEQIQNMITETNIRGGDVELSPTPEAAQLFSDYEAAMRYNARPICTLDEYLAFLGSDAAPSPESGISPSVALASNAARTFPAKYYMYLRRYRPGPPVVLPAVNQTNSSVLTSPDGLWVIPYGTEKIDVAALQEAALRQEHTATPVVFNTPSGNDSSVKVQPTVYSIGEDFPETTDDWDAALRIYRKNALTRLGPGR